MFPVETRTPPTVIETWGLEEGKVNTQESEIEEKGDDNTKFLSSHTLQSDPGRSPNPVIQHYTVLQGHLVH